MNRRTVRCLALGSVALGLGVTGTLVAYAQWSIPGRGTVRITTAAMPAGSTPEAEKHGDRVTVSWAAETIAPGVPMQKYVVTAHDTQPSPRADVAHTVTTTTATFTLAELGNGKWSWSVVPRYQLWSGAEGPRSTPLVPVGGNQSRSADVLAAPVPVAAPAKAPAAGESTSPPATARTTEAGPDRPTADPATSAAGKDPEPEKPEPGKTESSAPEPAPSETDSASSS
jgi:hypothetical protein